MKKNFDAIVIGSGQEGPFLAVRMAAAGQQAIIERHRYGGTCLNTGCMPTKTLVASAYNAHMARRAADFGVQVDGAPRVDMKRVIARKDEITGKSRSGLESWLKNTPNCTVYHGHAQFESPKEVRVGEELLTAPQIFINVGGRAADDARRAGRGKGRKPGIHESAGGCGLKRDPRGNHSRDRRR